MTDVLTLRQNNAEIMALCFSVVLSFSLAFDCCVLLYSVNACVCWSKYMCVSERERERSRLVTSMKLK